MRMKAAGLDVLLLAKPANMAYLTGDGRLCAYAMISKEGKVALGVPSTLNSRFIVTRLVE